MRLIVLAAPCLVLAAPAAAQPKNEPAPLPQTAMQVIACRAIQPAAERLACFDREVAAFEAAAAARELMVYDREQVRKTRRTLFGIPLPDLNIFGDGEAGGEGDEGFSQIESTLRSVRQDGRGRYLFMLEDGARWAQIDTRELSATPREGQKIRIRRAVMGSYLANVGSNVAIRVRRVLPGD